MQLKIKNKTINIHKLPIKKYVEVLTALDHLPNEVIAMQGQSNEVVVANLPKLVASILPQIIKILALAIDDLTEEQIGEMSFDEVSDLLIAVIKENKYLETFDKLKKGVINQPQ